MKCKKRWVLDKNGIYSLYFNPFCSKEKIAEVYWEDDGGWCYNCELVKAKNEYLGSDSIDNAKEDVEYLILEHYIDNRDYYQELVKEFLGGANE
jgi:hypothetical protein